jgi:hypothetical protein
VLSSQEQRIRDDVLRFWAEEVEEPPWAALSRTERSSRDQGDLPLAVVAGTWITVALVLFGAMIAALTVGVVTALGWALWHNWPRLSGLCTGQFAGQALERGLTGARSHGRTRRRTATVTESLGAATPQPVATNASVASGRWSCADGPGVSPGRCPGRGMGCRPLTRRLSLLHLDRVDGHHVGETAQPQHTQDVAPPAGGDHQPGAARPASPFGPGQRGDPSGAEEGHPAQVRDDLADGRPGGLRLEAEVQDRSGVGVDLAGHLDDHPAGAGRRQGGDRQQLPGIRCG